MTQFRKHLLIGIAAFGLGVGSVGAQTAAANDGDTAGAATHRHDGGKSREQMMERMAKRRAELHDKLKLTPAQETAWNAFIEKMKPAERPARPDRAGFAKLPAPERMDRMLAMMKQRQQMMENRVAATKQFYAVLTPDQQKIFDSNFGPRGGHHHRRHGGAH